MVDVPSAQERVTANATPAEAIAWTNADSLVAEGDMKTDTETGIRTEGWREAISVADNTQAEVLKWIPPGNNLCLYHIYPMIIISGDNTGHEGVVKPSSPCSDISLLWLCY